MNAFLSSYIAAALWSSNDDEGNPLDDNYSPAGLAPETLARMQADCEKFQAENAEIIMLAQLSDERAGHCFWLNRNGHGSGFWDEYSQTTCADYEREQTIAIGSRDFSKRDALDATCDCPYHACQRLSDACKAFGECNIYADNDGQLYI